MTRHLARSMKNIELESSTQQTLTQLIGVSKAFARFKCVTIASHHMAAGGLSGRRRSVLKRTRGAQGKVADVSARSVISNAFPFVYLKGSVQHELASKLKLCKFTSARLQSLLLLSSDSSDSVFLQPGK